MTGGRSPEAREAMRGGDSHEQGRRGHLRTTKPADMTPGEAESRALELSPKIVDEVRELHDRTVRLSREANGPRGRRGRRQRREAREAEADLLRVLGFASYGEFISHVGERASATAPTAAPPGTRGLSLVDAVPDIDLREDADDAGADVVALESDVALDARRTEAALLRVLRSERRGAPQRAAATEEPEDEVAALHARVAMFEEELAEARFEIRRVRDEVRSRPAASSSPIGADAAAAGDSPNAPTRWRTRPPNCGRWANHSVRSGWSWRRSARPRVSKRSGSSNRPAPTRNVCVTRPRPRPTRCWIRRARKPSP